MTTRVKSKTKKPAVKKAAPKAEKVTSPEEMQNGASEPVATFTVAESVFKPPMPEVHKIFNEFHEQPASKPELTIEELSQQAWDAVKGEGDADFASCQPSFRGILLYHAEGVRNSRRPLEGDSALARFEREVYRKLGG